MPGMVLLEPFGLALMCRHVVVYLDPGQPDLLKSWSFGEQPHDDG